MQGFMDRRHAGRMLSRQLEAYRDTPGLLVLALPRGGVPVAYEVARELGAELDVMLVRKLGVPGHAEFAMGAIASGDIRVLDEAVVHSLGISQSQVEAVIRSESAELRRREEVYRGSRPAPVVQGRTVILVDDGIATGASMKAAVRALRSLNPARIVVAVPAAPESAPDEFRGLADDFVSVILPANFMAVGRWYQRFEQTTDAEVCDYLAEAREYQLGGQAS